MGFGGGSILTVRHLPKSIFCFFLVENGFCRGRNRFCTFAEGAESICRRGGVTVIRFHGHSILWVSRSGWRSADQRVLKQQRQPAVDDQCLTRNVRGSFAAQEIDCEGDVAKSPHLSERDHGFVVLF